MSKQDRGFATLNRKDPDRMRAISRKGGQAAHEQGTAHKWSPEEAREAGRKGGRATAAKKAAQQAPKRATLDTAVTEEKSDAQA